MSMKFKLLVNIKEAKIDGIFRFKSPKSSFIMLINAKMLTIVGISTFMSRINFVLSCVEHDKVL